MVKLRAIIHISGRKLFGPGYSGLEYDYRGLLRLYHNITDQEKVGNIKRPMSVNKISKLVIQFSE